VERFDPGYTGPVTGPETRRICRVIRGLEKPGPEGVPQLNDADRLHLAALYRGSIRHTDDLFGDLLRLFEERGLFERTAIVVFSDHGEEFWDHGSLLHWHTVYQELVHVPFVIHAPGVGASLVPGTTRLMDITPTILELAGLPAHETHDGVSLVAALRGDEAARTRELASVTEMGDTKSLFEFPWKLVLDGAGAAPRLYDLERDPAEMSDVAAGQDSLVAAMAARLAPLVTTEKVTVLSKDPVTPEQHERLKALGYVN
jgi:arylsulfatase A-like enzyme